MHVRRASLSFAAGHRVNYYTPCASLATRILKFRARKLPEPPPPPFPFLSFPRISFRSTLISRKTFLPMAKENYNSTGCKKIEDAAFSCKHQLRIRASVCIYTRVYKIRTRVCVRAVRALPSGMWDPSGAFKYTERYYLRALDTRGATDSSLQNNTCLA